MNLHPISAHPVGSLSTPYFGVTEAAYPAHHAVPPHGHAAPSLTFVLRGRVQEKLPGRTERFGPRDFLLKPGGMLHSNRFGETGARLLLVEVLPELSRRSPALSRVLEQVHQSLSPHLAVLMLRVRRELRRGDGCASLCAEGLLLELMAELARAPVRPAARPEPWLERVRERLHAEFGRPLRIADLAAAEQVSPVRLSRAFTARYGRRVGEYARQVRLAWVADALLRTERPIAALAVEAGFTDQSHLTRDFRAAFGATPAAFRRTGRCGEDA